MERKLYDPASHYHAESDEFVCERCWWVMEPRGGIFEEPDTPAASFAEVFECPICGHAMDANLPHHILGETYEDEPEWDIRVLAADKVRRVVEAALGEAWEPERASGQLSLWDLGAQWLLFVAVVAVVVVAVLA